MTSRKRKKYERQQIRSEQKAKAQASHGDTPSPTTKSTSATETVSSSPTKEAAQKQNDGINNVESPMERYTRASYLRSRTNPICA